MSSTDEEYWSNYDGLQYAKHCLLKNYLGGWFPILSKGRGRVIYIDSHAGRGKHQTGEDGSPILAVKLLLTHHARNNILANTEVRYVFLENNKTNYDCLCNEIAALGQLPQNIHIDCYQEDYEDELCSIVNDINSQGQQSSPCFAFVDPYGFKLSMNLLNSLLRFDHCELLINYMFRHIDMAMHKIEHAANMDNLFGCTSWRNLVSITDYDSRSNEIINLFSKQLRAGYVTHMKMRGTNGALKYVLLHASNHRKGREVMKQAMWSVTPDGSFTASERTSPKQPVLITPEPDLQLLKQALWTKFAGKRVRMTELYDWLLDQIFIKKHLHIVLREYRNKGFVQATDFTDRFAFDKNPTIIFPKTRKD